MPEFSRERIRKCPTEKRSKSYSFGSEVARMQWVKEEDACWLPEVKVVMAKMARPGKGPIYALLIVCKFVRKLFVALKPLDGVVTLLFQTPAFDTFRTFNKALF